MAAIVSTLVFSGCADDVYDPERGIQTKPKENPLGEDFTAPDGFNWSMINDVNLNVEVKDEFNGQYQYLIEVFTSNPSDNADLAPIAAGVANKDKSYVAEINISKATTRLFIRQTDPKQRKEIYEYNIPENGGDLNCKLYYVATGSRAMTRASQTAGTSGWNHITDPGYTEENYNVPSVSTSVIYSNQLASGSTFVIKSGESYEGVLHSYNGANATIFVQGTWSLPDGGAPQGVDIIVLNGGKIVASKGFMVSDKSSLTIQSGGLVECEYFSTAANVIIKNFGTLQAKGIRSQYSDGQGFNTGTVLYNAAEAIVKVDESFHLTSAQIYNHGTITVGKTIQTNETKDCVIANYDKASINSDALYGGATVVNNGFIEVNTCKNSSEDALYNNCTFIVKEAFYFRNVILDKGSITGGRANPSDKEWLPVPYVESQTDSKFTLTDGSMIKAGRFKVLSGNVIFQATNQTNTDKSMIKAEDEINFTEPTHVQLLGNLVIEGKITGPDNDRPFQKNESVNTGFDESKYTIETCGGIFNEGEEGESPTNPEFPIEIGNGDMYTFAFEDNWPVYGDFDINDLVIVMSRKNLVVEKSGVVTRLRMTLELRAVGANKMLGAGMRFTKLPQNMQPDKFRIGSDDASFEDKQSMPTCILFNDAHTELWKSKYTDTERRINTIIDGPFKKDTKEYNIIMEIPASANVKPEDLNINNIDIFAITAPATVKGKRTEVHVAGFAPTDLGSTQYFKSGNDNSSVEENRYYLSNENLAWAVVIPQEFAWPIESKKITTVYDKFQTWITTGGQQNKAWYKSYNKDVYPIENLTPLNKN